MVNGAEEKVSSQLSIWQPVFSVGYSVSVNKCCSLSRPRKVPSVVSQLLEKVKRVSTEIQPVFKRNACCVNVN